MKLNNMPLEEIILAAKNKDNTATVALLTKYTPLINKYSSIYNIKSYDKSDLIQEANISILNSIEKFDLSKNPNSFDSYVINSIKNKFGTLVRKHARKNNELSLNYSEKDSNLELIDLLKDTYNIEESLIKNLSFKNLSKEISLLPKDIQDIIYNVYYKENITLRKYCINNKLPYTTTWNRLKRIFNTLSNNKSLH